MMTVQPYDGAPVAPVSAPAAATEEEEVAPDLGASLPQPTPPPQPAAPELAAAAAALPLAIPSRGFLDTLLGKAVAVGGPGLLTFWLGLYLGSPAGAAWLGHTSRVGLERSEVLQIVADSERGISAQTRQVVRDELRVERAETRREVDLALAPVQTRLDGLERGQDRVLIVLEEIKARKK